MNPKFLLAGAALLVVTLIVLFGVSELQEPQPTETADDSGVEPVVQDRDSPAPLVTMERTQSTESTAASVDPDTVVQEQQRVRDLEATLVLAQERLTEAEQGLAASEVEVGELEQMIAQIKARGEDPADYGDLALERFQPAFFRFQDAQAAYENAERLRAEAESALAAARAELARHRAAEAGEG